VDARGRMVIPAKILRSAELGRAVVLVGVGDHIEVWPRDDWRRRAAVGGLLPGAAAWGLGRGPVTS
jgi:DNA-binding transcriptional regulator/RsmH inhibitor MraZ